MTIRANILAAAALMFAATGASAAVHTITRHGSIIYQVPTDNPFNPGGLTGLLDWQVGDALSMSITYDDSELGPLQQSPNSFVGAGQDRLVNNPHVQAVQLGNGNPVNQASYTVGNHTVGLTDVGCYMDTACELHDGNPYHNAPNAIFYRGRFIGLEGVFGVGGRPQEFPNIGMQFAALYNFNLDLGQFFGFGGPTRYDYVLLQDAFVVNTVFVGVFDTPGIASVPEPASWAMLIAGFGLTGAALRGRTVRTVAA